MSSEIQTGIALLIVAFAAAWLVWRHFSRNRKPGCGGGCGCPTENLKPKPGR